MASFYPTTRPFFSFSWECMNRRKNIVRSGVEKKKSGRGEVEGA